MAKCDGCGNDTHNQRLLSGRWLCPDCGSYSPTPLKSGFLTRNSQRVAYQREKFGADLVQPHTYDKLSRKLIPNPDFVKLYPHRVDDTYSVEEQRKGNFSKAGKYSKELKERTKVAVEKQKEVIFEGSTEAGLKKLL